jgi:hypothetical protein
VIKPCGLRNGQRFGDLEYAKLEDVCFGLELATVISWTVIDDEWDNWGRGHSSRG